MTDDERFEHEAFAERYVNAYVASGEYYKRLDSHVAGKGQPLVVIGEAGSGKTALLASWAKRYREKKGNKPFLLAHFIGATPDSVEWATMVRRIMGELKSHFDIKEEIPTESNDLKVAFPRWLHLAAEKGKIVLVIDALDRLDDRDEARVLFWLPGKIPANIRLIMSTMPGISLRVTEYRKWPTLEVKPLNTEERKTLIVDYLAQFGMTLASPMIKHIASREQTGNPLYLRTLLEEVRLHGDTATVEKRIKHYLSALTPDDLYGKILERYEKDYDERKDLVKNAFSLLLTARNGLSQAELLDLLGTDGKPLLESVWSPLFGAAERSMVSSAGLLSFSNDSIRSAVRKRYLAGGEAERRYQLLLADYFEGIAPGKRKIEELPWQLAKAKEWSRLAGLLAAEPFFAAAWNADRHDVQWYWRQVEKNSPLRLVDAYQKTIRAPAKYPFSFVTAISTLIEDTGHAAEALSLGDYLTDLYRKNNDSKNLRAVLGSRAKTLLAKGDLDGAMKLFTEEETICRKLDDPQDLQACLGNQALVLQAKGDLDGALKLDKEMERICRKFDNPESLQVSLSNQAVLLQAKGDWDGAAKLNKEAETICRELDNSEGLQRNLGNQAMILSKIGDFDGALKLLKEVEDICRGSNNYQGLQTCLGNQAVLLQRKLDIAGAKQCLSEQECICREFNYLDGLQACLGSQAVIRQLSRDPEGAYKLLKEQERICLELNNRQGLQACLGNQALLLNSKGDFAGAMELLKKQQKICTDLKNLQGLQQSLGIQARLLKNKDDYEGALKIMKKQEDICRELNNPYNVQDCLGNQASLLLLSMENLEGALEILYMREKICREQNFNQELARSLHFISLALDGLHKPGEALPIEEEALKIAREHGYKELVREIESMM